MKNIVFLSIFFLSFISYSYTENSKTIDAELVSIKYYSFNKCKSEDNVYVMVFYKVDYKDAFSLKIRNEFSNGITTSSMVDELNKKNNIVYSFCLAKNEKKSFTTTFITPEGKTSNQIKVNININPAKIIIGTPPQTISNN